MKNIMLIVLLMGSLSLNADSQKCDQYRVNVKETAIIEDIKTPHSIITKLHRNDYVCVYTISGNWAKLGDGWIDKGSITLIEATDKKNDDAIIGPLVTLITILMFVIFILIHIFTTPKSDGRFSTGFRDNAEPMPFKKKLIISSVLSIILSIIIFMNGHT